MFFIKNNRKFPLGVTWGIKVELTGFTGLDTESQEELDTQALGE